MRSATNFKSRLLLLFGLAAAACSDPIVPEAGPAAQPLPDAAQELRIDPTIRELSEADATVVAERFARGWAEGGRRAVATRSGHLETIADTDGAPFAYVVNFDGGGFCIVGATKENYPVLAYDERSSLTIGGNGSGIADWIDYTVEAAKYRTAEEAAAIARQWADYEALPVTQASYYDDPVRFAVFNDMINSFDPMTSAVFPLQFLLDNPSSDHVPDDILRNARTLADQKSCPYRYFIIERINKVITTHFGPLLQTQWGQWHHNSLVIAEHPDCPTGCAAVAAAQIMNYYRKPEKYWNGEKTLDNLLYDLGKSFKIEYKRTGSGAERSDVIKGLNNDFDYIATEHIYSRVNMTTVRMPLWISAKDKLSGDRHSWICDGVQHQEQWYEYRMYYMVSKNGTYSYETDGITYLSNPSEPVAALAPYLHMNWGWRGTGDGWFRNFKVTTEKDSYDFSEEMYAIIVYPKS